MIFAGFVVLVSVEVDKFVDAARLFAFVKGDAAKDRIEEVDARLCEEFAIGRGVKQGGKRSAFEKTGQLPFRIGENCRIEIGNMTKDSNIREKLWEVLIYAAVCRSGRLRRFRVDVRAILLVSLEVAGKVEER